MSKLPSSFLVIIFFIFNFFQTSVLFGSNIEYCIQSNYDWHSSAIQIKGSNSKQIISQHNESESNNSSYSEELEDDDDDDAELFELVFSTNRINSKLITNIVQRPIVSTISHIYTQIPYFIFYHQLKVFTA